APPCGPLPPLPPRPGLALDSNDWRVPVAISEPPRIAIAPPLASPPVPPAPPVPWGRDALPPDPPLPPSAPPKSIAVLARVTVALLAYRPPPLALPPTRKVA